MKTAYAMAFSALLAAAAVLACGAPAKKAPAPVFDPAPGAYAAGQAITITTEARGTSIRYTVDGSEPTASSPVYETPIILSGRLPLRAAAFRRNNAVTGTAAGEYLTVSVTAIEKTDCSVDAGTVDVPSLVLDSKGGVHICYYDAKSRSLKYATNAGGSWAVSTIDAAGATGYYNSMAIDGRDGLHVSYCTREGYDLHLKYATKVDGPWICRTIDSKRSLQDTSIAAGAGGRVCIACFDSTEEDLVFFDNAGGGWKAATVSAPGRVGKGCCLKLGADGAARIAFHAGDTSLIKYADDSGGAWKIQSVPAQAGREGFTPYLSLALDAAGHAYISYGAADGMSKCHLGLASNAGGDWKSENLASKPSGGDGWWSSIAVDSQGAVHISYDGSMKYANNAGGTWNYYVIATGANAGAYNSLAVGSDGSVHVAYFDFYTKELKYALLK